ncbi:Fur family transcriptional regulator, ferric uptake regulator [Deinococcus reticulitermitis]|uniref:Fur family transcriptional regulator, ferric uptake regulator n=2 Tax=Deinococcus reticulitermitis TaxID=856736 RepID=A0A1H7A1Z4_9DEIO|nr:Fur family transcriptional regulator, ferric uptake regulator [Deinococcus reticulitermitis]
MVRQTKQRAAVIEVLQSARSHPDAAWVHAQVRERLPQVSLGTVYRTLDTLVRDGVVVTIERAGQATRYDYRHPGHDHHHAVCRSCGAIFDVEMADLPPLPPAVLPAGFQVSDVRLEFLGVCPDCADRALGESARADPLT